MRIISTRSDGKPEEELVNAERPSATSGVGNKMMRSLQKTASNQSEQLNASQADEAGDCELLNKREQRASGYYTVPTLLGQDLALEQTLARKTP